MVQKTSTFTSVIAASLVLLLGACPSISWSNTKIKDQITAQLTVRESKSKKIRNKSVVQRAKASIHRMTRRMAAQVHNLKKLLWGTGNFKNHYLRRIAGLSIIATGISVTNDVLSQKDNQYQPVIPKVTPTSNEPDRTPLEKHAGRVEPDNLNTTGQDNKTDKTDKRELFKTAIAARNTNLIEEALKVSTYEEMPFNELWTYARIHLNSVMLRTLIDKRECALRVTNSNPGEMIESEQKTFCSTASEEYDGENKDILEIMQHNVYKNNVQEVQAWLDITKLNKPFFSTIIKNAFYLALQQAENWIIQSKGGVSKNIYNNMLDTLFEYIPPHSNMLEIAKYAIDCGNFGLLHKLYDKQCAQPDQYLFFNDDGIKKLLDRAIIAINRNMLKKLITTQPYNKISSKELWKSVFSMNCQDCELARSLVEKRREAEADDDYINYAVNAAYRDNDAKFLCWLFKHGVTPQYGSALSIAINKEKNGFVRILLNDHIEALSEYGSDADIVAIDIWQEVIKNHNITVLELLFNHSSGIMKYANQVKEITQEVTLIPAPVTDIIIEYVVPTDNACELLKYAVQHGWAMGVSRLLENKARCRIMMHEEDSTLLDKAIENHDHEIAKILIAKGVKIHQAPLEKKSDKEALKQGNLNDLAQLLITKASLIGLEDKKRLEIVALAGLPDTIQPISHGQGNLPDVNVNGSVSKNSD